MRYAEMPIVKKIDTQMLHECMDYFTYMNGEKWPHEQGEMQVKNIPYIEQLAYKLN